jgi:hypothetical protein
MTTEPITRWIAAIGRWDFNNPGRATYLGPQPQLSRPFGICLSKSRLTEGDTHVTIQMHMASASHTSGENERAAAGFLFGYRSWDADYYTVGIGGHGFAYTLVHHQAGVGWRLIAFAGSQDDLKPAQDIVRGIQEARVVIAEITPANKNVFCEVGYAHALKVPTILLAVKGTELPFDIRGYRCILYENTIAGKRVVEEELGRHLDAILNG